MDDNLNGCHLSVLECRELKKLLPHVTAIFDRHAFNSLKRKIEAGAERELPIETKLRRAEKATKQLLRDQLSASGCLVDDTAGGE